MRFGERSSYGREVSKIRKKHCYKSIGDDEKYRKGHKKDVPDQLAPSSAGFRADQVPPDDFIRPWCDFDCCALRVFSSGCSSGDMGPLDCWV